MTHLLAGHDSGVQRAPRADTARGSPRASETLAPKARRRELAPRLARAANDTQPPAPAQAPLQVVLDRLPKATRRGHGWQAPCPAHDDRQPSLSVTEGSDGAVLLHCHAGCTPEAVVEAMGLRMADLYPARKTKSLGRVVVTYPYTDTTGTLLYEVVRYDPKGFKQRRPDGSGGWTWNLEGVRRVLYRLPEVLGAVREGKTVYVVEGEKDVDNLRSLGLVATCNAGGAGKWLPDYSDTLRGADVVIIPDKDTPGRKHGAQVSQALHGVASRVRVVVVPQGKDASDWLAAGGTLQDLEKLVLAAPPATNDWRAKLHLTNDGEPKGILHNAMLVLRHAEDVIGVVAHDVFEGRTVLVNQPPWPARGPYPRAVTDVDITCAAEWLADAHGVGASREVVGAGLDAVADQYQRDPLQEYLQVLVWDRKPRITRWLSTYLGADETDYTRAVGRAWLISGAARGLKPGCKADCMLLLEGRQGKRKSTALRILAGDIWFKDDLRDLEHKDAQEELRGVWILEFAELDALKRAGLARIKRFLSQVADSYRPAYGRYTVRHPRRCLFAATTNEADYFLDMTGNRRFWPVACGKIDVDDLRRDRDQLWAEAVVAYQTGEPWWLDEGMEAQAAEEQEARLAIDPWEERLAGWLAEDHPDGITTAEGLDRLDDGVLGQRMTTLRRTRAEVMRLGAIYRHCGYERRRGPKTVGSRVYRYYRCP